ncbi:MAG: DUF4440 domain-containing protein [Anaerolineales bacterium]|nr:DUF4440 domain-containing protein [Anaerolineales bacterium]
MQDAALSETIRALEERLLQPEIRRSVEQVDVLLADAFLEIGSSGKLYDKTQIVAALQVEPDVRFSLEDFRVRELAPHVVLAIYRTSRTTGDEMKWALRSSIWKLAEGRWQMVFHQGTPVETK